MTCSTGTGSATWAHQLSTATLLALLTWYLWVLERRWPIPSTEGALAIGGTWLVLTVLFEFGFGHYVTHDSWSQLLGNYDLAHGRGVPPLSRTPPMGGCPYGREGKRRRRQFTAEFKRDAVELVRTTGRPIAHIAAELGIYDSTLGAWVKQAAIDRNERDGLTSDERGQLRELQAENARLRMERDLLKRTVAFWVKETSTP